MANETEEQKQAELDQDYRAWQDIGQAFGQTIDKLKEKGHPEIAAKMQVVYDAHMSFTKEEIAILGDVFDVSPFDKIEESVQES